MAMALKQEELQIIGEYVQNHLTEWLPENISAPVVTNYPIELTERIIRVEEELKNQRELMIQGFAQNDKRFEQMQHNMDKRFEQVDKRFEQMQHNMDKRFEQVNKRFEQVDKRFEQVDKRFEQVDKRFEQVDKRFDQVDKRFDQVDTNFNTINSSIKSLETKMFQFMIWSFGFTATIAGIIIAVIKFV